MTKKERYAGVIAYFEAQVPIAETELLYNNPFELLVAVILSAQCTDKRVNLTTPSIFAKFPTPQKMANASFDDMLSYQQTWLGQIRHTNRYQLIDDCDLLA